MSNPDLNKLKALPTGKRKLMLAFLWVLELEDRGLVEESTMVTARESYWLAETEDEIVASFTHMHEIAAAVERIHPTHKYVNP